MDVSKRIIACPKCKKRQSIALSSSSDGIVCADCGATFRLAPPKKPTAPDPASTQIVSPGDKPLFPGVALTGNPPHSTTRIDDELSLEPVRITAPSGPPPPTRAIPPHTRARRRGSRPGSNPAPLFIASGALLLVGVVAFVLTRDQSESKAAAGSREAGKSESPPPAPVAGAESTDLSVLESGREAASEGTPPVAVAPTTPAVPRLPAPWEVPPDIRSRVETFLRQLGDGSGNVKEIRREIVAIGKEALPPVIEGLLDEDPMQAIRASGLLAALVGRNPVADPTLSVADRRRFFDQEKAWYLSHYYQISLSTGEDDPRARDEIRDEVGRRLREIAGVPSDRKIGLIRKLRGFGNAVVPPLIGFLRDPDANLAGAAADAIEELTGFRDFGMIPSGDRAEFARGWEEWWEKHKNEVRIQ